VGFAEKTAVIEHDAPFEVSPDNEYAKGLAKGALNVCVVPPHELVTVNVPVDGAFTNVMLPATE
jgi:hypothetical protein